MRLICIPAIKSHLKYLTFSIKYLEKKFSTDQIFIVTPDQDCFMHLNNSNVSVKADSEFLDISSEKIKSNLSMNKKSMFKWYYQQFLKYSIVIKSNKYDDILILDADTIFLSDCIEDSHCINFTSLEYNESYFKIIEKYFPSHKLLPKSAIVNFMWFNRPLLLDMLGIIQGNQKKKWFDVILDNVNKSKSSFAFSEYETYSNYKNNIKQSVHNDLKIFRRADLFMDYYSFGKIIKIAELYKFDLISFEENHNRSLLKTIIIFLMILIIELKLLFSGYYTKKNKIST